MDIIAKAGQQRDGGIMCYIYYDEKRETPHKKCQRL